MLPREIRIGRTRLFMIGLSILIFYIGLNRFDILWGTQKTDGEVIAYQIGGLKTGTLLHEIRFQTAQGYVFKFTSAEDVFLDIGEKVPVIFKKDNPAEAYVYNFISFWYPICIWALFPLILLLAAVYSFLKKDEVILMNLFEDFRIKKIRKPKDTSNKENIRLT